MRLIKPFFLITIFLCLPYVLAQDTLTNKSFMELHGLKPSPVAHFGERVIDLKTSFGDAVFQGEQTVMYASLDEQGKQLTAVHFSPLDGSIASNVSYMYDEDSKDKIQQTVYGYRGGLLYIDKYAYDDQGQHIETANYSYDGALNTKALYAYNQEGEQISEVNYNVVGEPNFEISYKYDEFGNKIEYHYIALSELAKNGIGAGLTTSSPIPPSRYSSPYSTPYFPPVSPYTPPFNFPSPFAFPPPLFSPYDIPYPIPYFEASTDSDFVEHELQPGENVSPYPDMSPDALINSRARFVLSEENEALELDTKVVKINYRYDDNSNQIEALHYNEGKRLVLQTLFEYDDNGNRTRVVNNHSDNEFDSQTHLIYDEHGNQIEVHYYGADNTLEFQLKCTYEYDDYSNWITKSCLKHADIFGEFQVDYDGFVNEITIRKIEYHEPSIDDL